MHYAGDSILVGDEVARAIEEYAMVLARRQGADMLVLPATAGRESIELVLGPASQLFSEAVEGPVSEDGDEELLADIRARIQGQGNASQPLFEDESEKDSGINLSDFDL